MLQEMKRNVLKRKRNEERAMQRHITRLWTWTSHKKSSPNHFIFLWPFFQNNCDLNNSIAIYENGYFVYNPNKSGV
jgi:hypothetical protein